MRGTPGFGLTRRKYSEGGASWRSHASSMRRHVQRSEDRGAPAPRSPLSHPLRRPRREDTGARSLSPLAGRGELGTRSAARTGRARSSLPAAIPFPLEGERRNSWPFGSGRESLDKAGKSLGPETDG